MRFEMGCDLAAGLADSGASTVEAVISILPTVTPFGMAALMPGADNSWKIIKKSDELVPSVADQPLPGVKERVAFLKAKLGDRYADTTLEQVLSIKEKRPPKQIAGADLLVVRTQEMDSYGEVMSLYEAAQTHEWHPRRTGDGGESADEAGFYHVLSSPPITAMCCFRKSLPAMRSRSHRATGAWKSGAVCLATAPGRLRER